METVKEAETRLGRKLSKSERQFKAKLDTLCACGHSGHSHCAPLLGGPDSHPCWENGCPCYSFPDGLTARQKGEQRATARLGEGE